MLRIELAQNSSRYGGGLGAATPGKAKLDPQNFLTAKSKKSNKFSFKLLKT
jgi:hypothetical protein